jgi:hypothetical protein
MTERVVVRVSCGAASAVALKLAIEQRGPAHMIHAVNAFVADEDADNRRFLSDVERWLGVRVVVLRDDKYGASVVEVWKRRRFIASSFGAPCSKALKRDVLNAYWQPGDVDVFGYTADLRDTERFDRYIDANGSPRRAWAPLIEAGITKDDCFKIITDAGLALPRMYTKWGYSNANCPKCPRGGMGYWNRIRATHPENFEEVASIQDVLGPGSYFFRDRKTGERISLRMLDPNAGRFEPVVSPDCGGVCELEPQLDLFARLEAPR